MRGFVGRAGMELPRRRCGDSRDVRSESLDDILSIWAAPGECVVIVILVESGTVDAFDGLVGALSMEVSGL